MQDEYSALYKLTAPYFPALGEVFVAVSAGPYMGRGTPMLFGEFFIFTTKDAEQPIGSQAYIQQHFASADGGKTGPQYLFDIAKIRASVELAGQIAKRLDLGEKAQFAHAPSLTESNWDAVLDLFRAGLIQGKVLSSMGNRTRSRFVLTATGMIRNERSVPFEDAKEAD